MSKRSETSVVHGHDQLDLVPALRGDMKGPDELYHHRWIRSGMASSFVRSPHGSDVTASNAGKARSLRDGASSTPASAVPIVQISDQGDATTGLPDVEP